MIYLQGTIGYTILKNNINNKKIINFADMHSNLPPCPYPKSQKIANWLDKKIYTSKLLLEEVDMIDTMELKELWESEHVRSLRKLFSENKNIIDAIDIRPYIIPFSWQLFEEPEESINIEYKNMLFKNYIIDLLFFFDLKNDFFYNKLFIFNHTKFINSKVGIHFVYLLIKLKTFIDKYTLFLNETLINLYNNNLNMLEEYNIIIDDCMEWYTCALINKYKNNTIIIHAGLYHTEKINNLLISYYDYTNIYQVGMNSIHDKEKYICQPTPHIL